MRIALTFAAVIMFLTSYSQDVLISSVTEWTVTGIEAGASVGFQSKRLWSYGGFLQQSVRKHNTENTNMESFAGVYCNAPIAKSEKVNFYIASRFGFVNKDFLVFVPGVETRLNISRRFGLNVGMGIRKSYPAVNGKISLALF